MLFNLSTINCSKCMCSFQRSFLIFIVDMIFSHLWSNYQFLGWMQMNEMVEWCSSSKCLDLHMSWHKTSNTYLFYRHISTTTLSSFSCICCELSNDPCHGSILFHLKLDLNWASFSRELSHGRNKTKESLVIVNSALFSD